MRTTFQRIDLDGATYVNPEVFHQEAFEGITWGRLGLAQLSEQSIQTTLHYYAVPSEITESFVEPIFDRQILLESRDSLVESRPVDPIGISIGLKYHVWLVLRRSGQNSSCECPHGVAGPRSDSREWAANRNATPDIHAPYSQLSQDISDSK